MATQEWREKLNSSSIFNAFSDSMSGFNVGKESLNILESKDDSIFVWNEADKCVLTTTLSVLNDESESSDKEHQVLMCSSIPYEKVTQILFNESGTYLALIGPNGITVLEVPVRWGRSAQFQGGKKRIICKSIPIAERFFICNPKVRVLQVKWFPNTESYIAVLSSDNYLRIYQVDGSATHSPIQTYCLSDNDDRNDVARSPSGGSLSVYASLGETAVSFDFGPKVEDNNASYWPVFVLRGNGDLYVVQLKSPQQPNRSVKRGIEGPLPMYPAADDNYGVDACSVLCLKSNPPVIVVASSSGTLYHCVALRTSTDSELNSSSYKDKSKTTMDQISALEWSLCVIESIELELSLTTSAYDEDIMCPISLHKDPTSHMRYHCSHSAGVHTLALPVISLLEQYVFTDEESALPNLQQHQCIVEHLICTKPLPTSSDSPIMGLAVVILPSMSGIILLCITAQFKPICLPISNLYHDQAPSLFSQSTNDAGTSPMKEVYKETFIARITRLLQRSASNPLLKSNPKSEPSPQECLQLLTRTTQVFREEYISRFDIVREEIDNRVRVLNQLKEQQTSDIDDNLKEQKYIKENADKLKAKQQNVYDKQLEISSRAEKLLTRIQQSVPILSDAERNLHKEYLKIEKDLENMRDRLEKVVKMKEYQQLRVTTAQNNKTSDNANTKFDDATMKCLKDALTNQTREIQESKKIVEKLMKELAL